MNRNGIRSQDRSRSSLHRAALAVVFVAALPASARAQHPLTLVDPALTNALERSVIEASPELAALRAALLAASAQADASGFGGPAIVSGEIDDVPGFDVADAGYRIEIGYEFLTGGRSAAARALASTDFRRA
jgi:hypothetical protein